MGSEWLRERIRQLHLDFHVPEFPPGALSRCDPRELARRIARMGANVVGVFTKCHFGNSYYPTRVGHVHRALLGDLFGETVEELHAYDIRVIAYYSLCTDERIALEHPDWVQVGPDGKPRSQRGTVWNQIGLNSPYVEEIVIPQMREIAQWYAIDAILLDIPYHDEHYDGSVFSLDRLSHPEAGQLHPLDPPLDPPFTAKQHIELSRSTTQAVVRRIADEVHRYRPQALIGFNGAFKMGDPLEVSGSCDYGLWESQPAHGTFLTHSIRARYARTLPVPLQIMTVRFTEDWGLMTCKSVDQLRYEFASILANGGIVNCGDQILMDGTLQEGAAELLQEGFTFVAEREAWSIGAHPVPHVALISGYTGRWYWDEGDPATLGAAKALIESHRQFDILWNDFDSLDRYDAVVTTDSTRPDERDIDRLHRFVEDGGVLFTTAGMISTVGRDRPETVAPLAELTGILETHPSPRSYGYYTLESNRFAVVPDTPLLFRRRAFNLQTRDCEPLAAIVLPDATPPHRSSYRNRYAPPGAATQDPAIVRHRLGAGAVITFAFDIFSDYWQTNHWWLRETLAGVVDTSVPGNPYRIDAGPGVEANLLESRGSWYLHLVSYQPVHSGRREGAPYDPVCSPMELAPFRVAVRKRPGSVKIQPQETPIPFEYDGEWATFEVPGLRIHTIVEIEPA